MPWRGRITLAQAPGRPGSSDKTAAAADEVAAFFGQAARGDFRVDGQTVAYDGPEEWSYRRFVLHYAHLCALAGGVDAFCIGSELRGLTQIRDSADGYPAVRALLRAGGGGAGDPRGRRPRSAMRRTGRSISGISRPTGRATCSSISTRSGRRRRSISSASTTTCRCRTGATARATPTPAAGSIYDLGLPDAATSPAARATTGTMPTPRARDAQDRLPIADGAYGEDWVFRYKDLVELVVAAARQSPRRGQGRRRRRRGSRGRSRSGSPSSAARRWTRAPTSRTSSTIRSRRRASSRTISTGARDDFIQYRYLQAMFAHWNDAGEQSAFGRLWRADGRHVARACLGVGRAAVAGLSRSASRPGSTATNYERGHWLNGRASIASLAEVVAEICGRCGLAIGRCRDGCTAG